ncbi:MAG: hypothetical protein IT437_09910 [Phycisphaerales bacterium]|nr:hypothetical protein [Phycisphaerales bacterium]
MILALGAALTLLLPAQVELRGGEAPPPGRVVSVTAAGVMMTADPESAAGPAPGVIIGWDRVRSVGGDFAGAAAPLLPMAEKAWRARTRLERGDAIGAEPLFEELFTALVRSRAAGDDPTLAVAAEGLLRCRMRRGAHVAAVEPWLVLRRDAPSGAVPWLHADWSADAGLSPILDPKTRLIPGIPPMWVGNAAARSLAGIPMVSEGGGGDESAEIGALYLAAARFEAGERVPMPVVAANDPGVALVADVVAARIGDATQRESARTALRDRLGRGAGDTPPWMAAWCRAALGRSMIVETDPVVRQLGVVELLRVPAEMEGVHPYLGGLALAEASVTLRDAGDAAGADTLRDELFQRYPGHPVLDWPPILARSAPRKQGNP